MKKYTTSLLSALLLVTLLISGFIFDFSSTDRTATAAGFIYQDFENPVFPPAG